MKKIILYFTIIASNYNCNAQSINDNWILGNNLIHFDNSNVTVGSPPVNLTTDAGASSIVSDENGDLLFYLANNNKLYDKNGITLGTLTSNFYEKNTRQNSLILPNPMNKNEFIGFSSFDDASGGVYTNNYQTYKVTFNDSSYPGGKLVNGSNRILNGSFIANTGYASLSATSKADNSGYYLIAGTKSGSTPQFVIKEINFSDNSNYTFNYGSDLQQIGLPSGLIPSTFNPTQTLSKISSNGSHFAFILSDISHNYVFLADFDNSSGGMSNFRFVKYSSNQIKDIEFSSDSSLLYMLIDDIVSIRDVVNFSTNEKVIVETNPLSKSNFQRASDGEIYILDSQSETNWPAGYVKYSADKMYKIINSNDVLNATISSNYSQLTTPIEVFDYTFSGKNKISLFMIPELVESKIYCPFNLTSKTTDITEYADINISATNQINLKHLIRNSTGEYVSGNNITLTEGFSIKSGSNVIFKIDECTSPLPRPLNKTSNNESTNKGEVIINITDEIKVYPNPFSEFVNLDLSNYNKDTNFILVIYDIHGKKVKDYKFTGGNTEQLRLNELSSGIYVLKVFSTQGLEKSFKLIKK